MEWDSLTAGQPLQSVFVVHFVASLPPLATRTYFLHLSPRPHTSAAALTEQSVTTVYSQHNKAGRERTTHTHSGRWACRQCCLPAVSWLWC